ncbi:helix-turn-helix domain-containing protein [uncultured Clostridium sp.]|uniref:helix-turn-helix domain-containing protein n=1 Tax=uncultured Clostridium sp. TaxID=59620 RepID=UPI0026715EFA|nr:helix-turn-helix transcriptional regulator [uncultured Clostridium sp.]
MLDLILFLNYSKIELSERVILMLPHEKLKLIRLEKGLSTYDLSELTGIPQSTISKMENGKRKLETDSLRKLSEVLNISISAFFDEEKINENKNISLILAQDETIKLSDRIKDLRKQKGWTQADLHKKTGISMGMIGGIENGTRNPSDKSINKLAEAFGVSQDWLKSGKEKSDTLIEDFLNRLIDEKIITSTILDEETKEIILKAVETEIAVLLKKKNNR